MKNFISKHLQTIALVLLMLMSVISCRRGNRTTIETTDGSTSQKIEYAGRIVFNRDQTQIESIAKDGYIKYTYNGRSVQAKNGHDGKVAYQFNGDSKVSILDNDQKQFLSYAIKTIIKERAKVRAN